MDWESRAKRFDNGSLLSLGDDAPATDPTPYEDQTSLPMNVLPELLPASLLMENCDKSTGPIESELLPVPDVAAPVPDPLPPRSTGPFGAAPLVPPAPAIAGPPPAPVPPNSTGPFGPELLPAPEVDAPLPEPVPLKSTGPFGSELLLPVADEPVPAPEPPRSTGPFGAVPLLAPEEEVLVADPVPLRSTGPIDCEPLEPDVEVGVELPPVTVVPAAEALPESSTGVVDPKPLNESSPSPASIARGSSDSKAVLVDGCVFLRRADRMAAPLLDLSEKKASPPNEGSG